jgi:acetate kinase
MGVVVGDVTQGAEVLVVNVGSSSVKLRLLGSGNELLDERDLGAPGDDEDELRDALGAFHGVQAVGHRIVHGGSRFTRAAVVDEEVRAALEELVELAPLHQPPALAALDIARAALPQHPHVACFDTAFHTTMPEAASTYALPAEWRQRLGIRRYGFHGLSHAYAARRAAALLERDVRELRLVTCHLGAGASLCAVRGGRSVDTTMGFTPLEGLVMSTRSGSVDPGLVLWLIRSRGMDPEAVEHALERASGLLGLAGTGDMRELLGRIEHDLDARLAFAVYCHRLRAYAAAMTASLGGIDALVFTGGVGERSPHVRAAAIEGLGFLGLELDSEQNQLAIGDGDLDLSPPSAACRTMVVVSREDVEIATQVRAALAAPV